MIRDEIKNKIQLKTTNVNKKIANKRKGIESKGKKTIEGLIWFSTWPACKSRKKEKKEKLFLAKPHQTTIHASSKEEKNAETNPMMRWKRQYNHRSEPHTSFKVSGAANALASTVHVPTAFLGFFCNCTKLKMPSRPINNHKTNHGKITTKPLNARLKN